MIADYVGDLYEKNLTTGQETKRYMLGSTLVATSVGGVPSYLYADYLHSVVGASNSATVEYTRYGLVRASSGTLPTDHRFQGQQAQAGIGLDHMGARWYDPTIGAWTQPDSIVPNPTDPLALNRYAFVEGNPLRYRDPSRHTVEIPSTLAPSGIVIDIAPALQVDQAQINVQAQSLPTRQITTVGPSIGTCCIDAALGVSAGPAIQTSPSGLVPQVFAASGGSPASASDTVAVSTIEYGPLDSLGRATGGRARLERPLVRGGATENKIKPPGLWTRSGLERGHLLGRQLGGSGGDPRNFVSIYQDANYPEMGRFENQVARAVSSGQTVDYAVTPVYDGDNPIPIGITLDAKEVRGSISR